MGNLSTWMGDSALLMSDGFATRASRPKPLPSLFNFIQTYNSITFNIASNKIVLHNGELTLHYFRTEECGLVQWPVCQEQKGICQLSFRQHSILKGFTTSFILISSVGSFTKSF